MADKPVRVELWVVSADDEVIARAAEMFGRTAAGLAMDGADCTVMVRPDDDLDDLDDT